MNLRGGSNAGAHIRPRAWKRSERAAKRRSALKTPIRAGPMDRIDLDMPDDPDDGM
jgi:hypothetical protein